MFLVTACTSKKTEVNQFIEKDERIQSRIRYIQALAIPLFGGHYLAQKMMRLFEVSHLSRPAGSIGQVLSAAAVTFCLYDIFKQVKAYQLVHEAKKGNAVSGLHDQDVALVLNNTHDEKGAFGFPHEEAYFARKLHEGNYALVWRDIKTKEDLVKSFDEILQGNNKIKVLFIRAHGYQTGFTIGKNFNVEKNELIELQDTFNKLDEKAVVVFESCLVGSGKQGRTSIAEVFAQLVPGRKVYAAWESTYVNSITITHTNPLQVKYDSVVYDNIGGVFECDVTKTFLYNTDGRKVPS